MSILLATGDGWQLAAKATRRRDSEEEKEEVNVYWVHCEQTVRQRALEQENEEMNEEMNVPQVNCEQTVRHRPAPPHADATLTTSSTLPLNELSFTSLPSGRATSCLCLVR